MALTIPCDTSRVISIEEYVEYIGSNVDLRNVDSIAASAMMLRALANNRDLVVRRMNQEVEESFRRAYIPSAQALFLGKGKNFYVRASIWPSAADVATGRVYQEQFSYNQAHDHNFTFMTVNYLGPGYDTDIYEYDHARVEGYVGEPVDIRFLGKVRFGSGAVMLYHASRDIHIQYPPQELTITLNLMISLPEVRMRDQFYFDVTRKVISGYPGGIDSSKHVSMIKMAGYLGNADTRQLLTDLARSHSCRRTRLAAYESMVQQTPDQAAAIWERACADFAPLVSRTAREKLAKLTG